MAPLRVSTTKSEWLPDDPTAFVPTRLWKLPFITTWDDPRNQNRPTDSAEEAKYSDCLTSRGELLISDDSAETPAAGKPSRKQIVNSASMSISVVPSYRPSNFSLSS